MCSKGNSLIIFDPRVFGILLESKIPDVIILAGKSGT